MSKFTFPDFERISKHWKTLYRQEMAGQLPAGSARKFLAKQLPTSEDGSAYSRWFTDMQQKKRMQSSSTSSKKTHRLFPSREKQNMALEESILSENGELEDWEVVEGMDVDVMEKVIGEDEEDLLEPSYVLLGKE